MKRSKATRQYTLGTLVTVAMAVPALPALGKPMPGHAGLPDTQAGRRAEAFFTAFNSGNDATMRSFESQHRAKSALERRPIDERIGQYHELRANWGNLEVDGVFDSKELELSIGVNADETDDFLTFRFELEPEAPHGRSTRLRKRTGSASV